MKVVVTGATGRIGRIVCARLAADGMQVVALGDGRRVDVRDAREVADAIRSASPSTIVHLAGRKPPASRGELFDDAGRAARAIMSAAAENGAAVVMASSAAVYGTRSVGPVSESDPLLPSAAYGEGKVLAERIASEVATTTGTTLSILRIFNVVGPGMADSLPVRLSRATEAAPVVLHNLDGFVRDYVHVDDVAEAVVQVVDLRPAGVTTWNIGTGVATSTRELLAALGPSVQHHVIDPSAREPDVSWADITRARDAWGYRPRVDLGPEWVG